MQTAAGVQAGTVLCGGQQRCMPHLAAIFSLNRRDAAPPVWTVVLRLFAPRSFRSSFPDICNCLTIAGTFAAAWSS